MNRPFADKDVLAKRAARFTSAPVRLNHRPRKDSRRQDAQNLPHADKNDEFDRQLVGTCEMLEKCYLRLTAAPKESDIRPRHVLVKSLEKIKELWEEKHDYRRVSDLLKSVRQDITVQGIRDELSIDVYETHAKFALHSKDPSEFNVCLSVLESLYHQVPSKSDLRNEFKACRILYYLYTGDLADLTSLLGKVLHKGEVSPSPPCLDHAVQVAVAWLVGSHHRLLQLYKTASPLSSLVMDLFIDRDRRAYYNVIITAYRPNVPADFVTSELLLDKSEAASFFSQMNTIFTDASCVKIDCKASLTKMT